MRDPDEDQIPLTHVIRALIALGYCCKSLTYIQLYHAILSGQIPAEQRISSRWSVRRADLPKVASVFGLTMAPDLAPHAAVAGHAISA